MLAALALSWKRGYGHVASLSLLGSTCEDVFVCVAENIDAAPATSPLRNRSDLESGSTGQERSGSTRELVVVPGWFCSR